jgi:hypothetical protein
MLLCFLNLQILSNRSGAASRLSESFLDMMRIATAVVEVEVIKLEQKTEQSNWPAMIATLSISRIYKGDIDKQIITVEYIGGFQNKQEVLATGQPRVSTGDRAVLLLKKHDENAAHWRIVGGDAGHVILKQKEGQCFASRAAGTFEFFLSDTESITGYKEIKTPHVSRERLDKLLQALLTTGNPVIETPASTTTMLASNVIGKYTGPKSTGVRLAEAATAFATIAGMASFTLLMRKRQISQVQ